MRRARRRSVANGCSALPLRWYESSQNGKSLGLLFLRGSLQASSWSSPICTHSRSVPVFPCAWLAAPLPVVASPPLSIVSGSTPPPSATQYLLPDHRIHRIPVPPCPVRCRALALDLVVLLVRTLSFVAVLALLVKGLVLLECVQHPQKRDCFPEVRHC